LHGFASYQRVAMAKLKNAALIRLI
jgi:hypothetical protein